MTTAADKSAITAKLAEARSLVAALPSSGPQIPPPSETPDGDPPVAIGAWSLRQNVGPYPFGATGSKHVTLLKVGNELLAIGGDYGGGVEICPNGYRYVCASNRRNIYAAPLDDPARLAWKLVQPMFMPDLSGQMQCQGPRQGPDQVWAWQDIRGDIWVGPGFYRTDCESRIPFIRPYEGEAGIAFKWLRPGWFRPPNQRKKVPQNYVTAEGEQVFKRIFGSSNEPDKYCAYDPVTDAAYCLHDYFEIIKYDHATNDWDHVPSGAAYTNIYSKAKDDQGRPLYPASDVDTFGSFNVRVGRRIYALMSWHYQYKDRRQYLAWFDIDTKEVGAITLPIDHDYNYLRTGPNGETIYFGNPNEHSFIVALGTKIVLAVGTYYGVDPRQEEPWKWNGRQYVAGNRPIWTYDTATSGPWLHYDVPVPEWIGGNAMVAIPEANAIALMGSTANPATLPAGGWDKAAFFTFAGAA